MRIFTAIIAASLLFSPFAHSAAITGNGAGNFGGYVGSAGDVTNFTTSGVAQTLFGGVTPLHGFSMYNPNLSDDCWVSDSTTAAANGAGSIRLPADGGGFETPMLYRPAGAVSLWCPTAGDKMTVRQW